jgi:two-component system, sensor histidine kinase and response regulator
MKGDKERCLASGMDGYLSKPIRARDLFETIEDVSIAASERSPDVESNETVGAEFDGETLLARMDGNTELCAELIETFFQESPRTMSAIKIEVERRDAAAIASSAHALKGAIANFGANHRSFSAAVALELCGKSGDLSEIEPLMVEATEALRRLHSEMSSFSENVLCTRRKA